MELKPPSQIDFRTAGTLELRQSRSGK